MKRIVFAMLALVATACGSQQVSSVNESSQNNERELVYEAGEIRSVVVKAAPAPAHGMWTEVTVGYTLPCHMRFEKAALSYDRGLEGKYKIFSAAFLSRSTVRSDIVCLGIGMHTETLSLPGIVAEEDLTLVNLAADKSTQKIPAGTADVASSWKIELVDARPMCPPNAFCALNGTIATVNISLGSCVNTLGPISLNAEQIYDQEKNEFSNVKLKIHAIDLVHESAPLVRCTGVSANHEISLPHVFGDIDSIDLQVLK
jgi:hypothetical protein